MKTLKLLFAGAALFAALTIATYAQTNAPTTTVQLTPDQIAKLDAAINSGVTLIPVAYQGLVESILGILVVLASIGRSYKGWQVNGISGVLSGLFHGTNTPVDPAPTPTVKSSNVVPILLAAALASMLVVGTACNTTPQQASYQAAGTTEITVETAVKTYNVFAAQGKTTVEQNRQVKAAYEKYQLAMAVLCDAGAVYAASNTTNAPASAAFQQATLNASASLTDIINLIQTFGVKL